MGSSGILLRFPPLELIFCGPMTPHLLLALYLKCWPVDPQGIHFVCVGLCQSCHKSVSGCQKYWVFDQGEIPTDPAIANPNLMKWYCIRTVKPWITIDIWVQLQSHVNCLKHYYPKTWNSRNTDEAFQNIFENGKGLMGLSRMKLNQGKKLELLLKPLVSGQYNCWHHFFLLAK